MRINSSPAPVGLEPYVRSGVATINAMQGLEYNQPTEIGVSFTANPVIVSTWRVNDFGLMADVPSGDGVDRYFVPWSQLKYAKQHIVTPAP